MSETEKSSLISTVSQLFLHWIVEHVQLSRTAILFHTHNDRLSKRLCMEGGLGFYKFCDFWAVLLICSYAGFICLVDGPLAYTIFNQLHVVTCL